MVGRTVRRHQAKQIIEEFAARRNGGQMWKGMDRATVAAGALVRIDDPDKINQGEAEVCGPACFVHAIATDSPVDYARAVVGLFENGRAVLGGRGSTLTLTPSSDLMNYTLPATARIEQVDWIVLASVRDSQNWFFNYSSPDEKGRFDNGRTKPGELEDWFEDAGYTDVRNTHSSFFTPGFLKVRDASDLYLKGYKVALVINDKLLYTDKQDEKSSSLNHFVALASPITITDRYHPPVTTCWYEGRSKECGTLPSAYDWKGSTVSLKVYTWGGIRNVPLSGTLSAKSFAEHFYGYVAGKY